MTIVNQKTSFPVFRGVCVCESVSVNVGMSMYMRVCVCMCMCSIRVDVGMSVYRSECGVSMCVGEYALAINGNKGGEDSVAMRRRCWKLAFSEQSSHFSRPSYTKQGPGLLWKQGGITVK